MEKNNLINLIQKSKANIPNKEKLIHKMRKRSIKTDKKIEILKLDKHPNYQRCGELIINNAKLESLKIDVYEYFKNPQNYFDLDNSEIDDFSRLKEILMAIENEQIKSSHFIKKNTDNQEKSIDELKKKYPEIYQEFNLADFKELSYIEQGKILKEISKKIKPLSHLSSYLNISESAISKRIKAYKIECSFPEEKDFLTSLSKRQLEAFPSDYNLQSQIISHLKETNNKINRAYIFNLRKIFDFDDYEKILYQNLEKINEFLNKKKFKCLKKKDRDRVLNHFNKIEKIFSNDNVNNSGGGIC